MSSFIYVDVNYAYCISLLIATMVNRLVGLVCPRLKIIDCNVASCSIVISCLRAVKYAINLNKVKISAGSFLSSSSITSCLKWCNRHSVIAMCIPGLVSPEQLSSVLTTHPDPTRARRNVCSPLSDTEGCCCLNMEARFTIVPVRALSCLIEPPWWSEAATRDDLRLRERPILRVMEPPLLSRSTLWVDFRVSGMCDSYSWQRQMKE